MNIREVDVIFGNEENNVIRSLRTLMPGNKQFSESLTALITNDFVSEEFECFTMRIGTTDTGGVRRVFNCTSDSDPGDDFFCQTTICIVDDYGKDLLINFANNIMLKISEPFVVGFVETAYYTVNALYLPPLEYYGGMTFFRQLWLIIVVLCGIHMFV